MTEGKIVKIIAHPDITRFFRTFDTPTTRLLREAGFELGDLTLRHYLDHYYSLFSQGYNTTVVIYRGLRIFSTGGIYFCPNDPEKVWENLLGVASRYLGIGPEPLNVDPPYIVLTTPDESERVVKAFRFLDCVVEEVERKQIA